MSRILFWIFSLQKCTRLSYEQLWKRKRTRNNRSRKLFTIVSQTRLFTDFINSSPPSANVARRLFSWTQKNTKKGFLQSSIFPIKCVISDTNINDDTLYFRQLSWLCFGFSAQLSAHPLFGISCGSFEFLPPFSDS